MNKILCTALVILITAFSHAQDNASGGNDATFNFIVSSKAGKPREGELILLKSRKTGKFYPGRTAADGKGSVIIPPADTYTIYYKLFADTVKYKDIEVPGGDHKMTYTYTLKYDPPKTYTLDNVFFETGLATLRPESFPALDELVAALKSKPALVIEIAGHTDDVGTAESNLALSTDRARSVRNYLLKQGIDAKRVTATGYGETQPVADNETPEGRQKNRRTEVRIISD